MQRLSYDLVRDMGTIKVSRIDMVHAARDGLSQNSDRCIEIAGRSPYQFVTIPASELHRTVSHTVHCRRRARQCEAPGESSLFNHSVPPGTVRCLQWIGLERLSHQLFTFLPERFCIFRIERISAHTFADGGNGRVVRHCIADVTVLAIPSTDFGS